MVNSLLISNLCSTSPGKCCLALPKDIGKAAFYLPLLYNVTESLPAYYLSAA